MNDQKGNNQKEQVTALLARAAHDMRSPMQIIVGQAELMKMHIALGKHNDQEATKRLDEIIDAAMYVAKITDDILFMYRGKDCLAELIGQENTGEPLGQIFDRALFLLQQHAAPKFSLSISLSAECYDIVVHYGHRIRRIVQNIVLNAAQSSSNDGDVGFDARIDSGNLIISISDNGYGIDADSQTLLAHNDLTSHWLGMLICAELAQAIGGNIVWRSRPHSCVTITLPLQQIKDKQA